MYVCNRSSSLPNQEEDRLSPTRTDDPASIPHIANIKVSARPSRVKSVNPPSSVEYQPCDQGAYRPQDHSQLVGSVVPSSLMPGFVRLFILLVDQLDKARTTVLLDLLPIFTDKHGLVLIECVFEMADTTEVRGADDEPADAESTGRFPGDCFLPLFPKSFSTRSHSNLSRRVWNFATQAHLKT